MPRIASILPSRGAAAHSAASADSASARTADVSARAAVRCAASPPPFRSSRYVLGQGAFHWTKVERQTSRWGAFYLDDPDSGEAEDADASSFAAYDQDTLRTLVGRRVRLRAEIVALAPATPARYVGYRDFLDVQAGDVVELGVGILRIEAAERDFGLPSNLLLALETGRRATYWMRPDAFWYLRGHTVALHAELTSEAFAPTRAALLADSSASLLPVIRGGRRRRLPTVGHVTVVRRTHAAWRARAGLT
jgi:hypothetical protein